MWWLDPSSWHNAAAVLNDVLNYWLTEVDLLCLHLLDQNIWNGVSRESVRHTFSRSEKGMSLRFPHSSPDLLAEKIYHIRFWRCYPIRKMFVQSGAPQIFLLNRMLESLPMQMQLERSLFRFSDISYTSHFVFYVATFNIMYI